MKKSIVCLLGILAAAILPAGAATLARYQFSGNYLNNFTLPAGITSAGPISFAPGLTETLPSSNAGFGISSNPANTLYLRSAILHETTVAAAIGADDYFSFDVTITPGFTLDLNSITASHWTSTASPTDSYTSNVAVYYTLNGTDFSSEAVAVKLGEQSTGNTAVTQHTFSENLGGNEALTGTVRFHFVFWDPAGTNLENRVARLDDIIVDGTVTAVPESSMLSIVLSLSLIPVLCRRR